MSMLREVGLKEFPIWLLGDSEPVNSNSYLETPFDPRHPVRHNIWTSISDVMQDYIYRENGKRIDASKVFIRNAITDVKFKPERSAKVWDGQVLVEIEDYRKLRKLFKPQIILTFGSFSYEFARRTYDIEDKKHYGYWDTLKLGDEFRAKMACSILTETRVIPLLHRSISSGRFAKGHKNFCKDDNGNYFEYCGNTLAKLFLENQDKLDIWIER